MMKELRAGAWRKALALLTALLISGLLLVPAALADTTAPEPPTSLWLNPADLSTNGQVIVSWAVSPSTDVTRYRIYRFHVTNSDGASRAEPNETTFLNETTNNYLIDLLQNEGEFRYAVEAVDGSGNRSRPTAWGAIGVNFPNNGQTIAADRTAPRAPTALQATWVTASRDRIDLSWTAPSDRDLWRYLVYRAEGNGAALFRGYVDPAVSYFTDDVAIDKVYTYHVVAQDRSGNLSPASSTIQVMVDTTRPVVEITGPSSESTPVLYRPSGLLTVTASIIETGSGYDPAAVKIYLDGAESGPVINLATLTGGLHSLLVQVTDRAGNIGHDAINFRISNGTGADAARITTQSGFTRSNELSFNWEAPQQAGVTGYSVYRVKGDESPVLLGITAASATGYQTMVPTDGLWSFYVVASYGDHVGQASGAVAFTVDLAAPGVRISSPEDGKSYPSSLLTVPVTYSVTDPVYGTGTNTVTVLLDGQPFTGTTLRLAGLAEGNHTLKVIAADRAGNEGYAIARFAVNRSTGGGDDDEDDEDDEDEDDRPGKGKGKGSGAFMPDLKFAVDEELQADILAELARWAPAEKNQRKNGNEIQSGPKIQLGHYKSLRAKAEAGAWRSFVFHLYKHRGRFIPARAADALLELLGAGNLDIDPREIPDSEIEGWGNGNNPDSKGKGKKD